MSVPDEVINAIELFDIYILDSETDKTILAEVVTKLSKFAPDNSKNFFIELAQILEGKSGNKRLALNAIWQITSLEGFFDCPDNVYQKLIEIEKAAFRAI